MSRLSRLLVLVLTLIASPAARADEPPPVQLGALVRGFAIPAQGRPDVQAAGTWRQRIDVDDVNEYGKRENGSESILLDGETAQVSYNLRYGVVDRWELALFVPFLVQGGGILDPVIQDWHRFWGFPNGGRERAPSDRYLYQYARNGASILDVERGSSSFGDIQLATGYHVTDHLAARAMFKLPTGSAGRLSGNEASGGAFWLDGGVPLKQTFRPLTLYASIGCSLNAPGRILPRQQKRTVPFGAAGLRVQFTDRWDARLQIYVNAPAYKDSELTPLARVGVPLTITTSYRFSPKTTFSIGFQEKAIYLASPDFGVHLGLAFDSR